MENYSSEPGSFRDRNGRVFYSNGEIYRSLSEQALKDWYVLSSTSFFSNYINEKKIVGTELLLPDDNIAPPEMMEGKTAFLKHQIIPFISYPYEWCFGMLKSAALLQLELLDVALDEEMILKDSSAFNFQWFGANPVFIDIPSFERVRQGEPWIGYRQFCQMFLYPLFLQAYKDVPFHSWVRGDIEGIEPEDLNNLMSLRDMFRPGVFTNVFMHSKAQGKYNNTEKNIKNELSNAGFHRALIKSNIKRLRKTIEKLKWKRNVSEWSGYTETHSYEDDLKRKKDFVRTIVNSEPRWKLIWDLGCNTGVFSKIASENAEYVVAMDADHLAIERFYQALKDDGNRSILPLVMNVSNPSPDHGWRGLERKNLSARGTPDLTLCLALIHHIVISANIPLNEFIDWLASLNTSLIIEFVTKEDQMVKTLLRNKEDQYTDYEVEFFEKCLSEKFSIMKTEKYMAGTRVLYYARNNPAA